MIEIKTKLKVILSKLKSFCATKENYKQGENKTLRTGEKKKKDSKWNKWQRIDFQKIQGVHVTHTKKNKIKLKSGEKP